MKTKQSVQKLSGKRLQDAVAKECFGWTRERFWYGDEPTLEILDWLNKREIWGASNVIDGQSCDVTLHRGADSPRPFTGHTFAISLCRAAVWSARNQK